MDYLVTHLSNNITFNVSCQCDSDITPSGCCDELENVERFHTIYIYIYIYTYKLFSKVEFL